MTGKVYLITGANKGIGFALTTVLAADPANTVLATARVPSKADDLNKLAEKGNVHVLTLDISSQESVAGLDDQLSKFAPDGIDYLISNAGIGDGSFGKKAIELPAEIWLNIYSVNVLGSILVTQKVYPHLLKKNTRVIYLMSSIVGSIGQYVAPYTTAYGQSKAALNHYGKELSVELKDEGFTVVMIHPGTVRTEGAVTANNSMKNEEYDKMLEKLYITPQTSAEKQVELINKLTKDDSGKFLSYDGSEILF